jgi:hypothetical protein
MTLHHVLLFLRNIDLSDVNKEKINEVIKDFEYNSNTNQPELWDDWWPYEKISVRGQKEPDWKCHISDFEKTLTQHVYLHLDPEFPTIIEYDFENGEYEFSRTRKYEAFNKFEKIDNEEYHQNFLNNFIEWSDNEIVALIRMRIN